MMGQQVMSDQTELFKIKHGYEDTDRKIFKLKDKFITGEGIAKY